MKVLMTTDTVGGVWRYAIDLAAGLQRSGMDVVLATLGGALRADQRNELKQLPNATVHELNGKLEWMHDPWEDLEHSGERLLRIASDEAVDFVHLNHLVHADLPFDAPVVTVVHSCVLSWWEAVHHTGAPAEWDVYREKVGASVRAANRLVTATRAMRDEVLRLYAPPDNVTVIHNSSRLGETAHSSVVSEPKSEIVASAGRVWDDAKNIRVLDQAAPDIGWPVFIAGSTCSPDGRLISLQASTPLGALSYEQVQGLYARASIYALPARYEPFGLSVLEAAYAGCALVLGDIPSLRENWDDAALFVAPESASSLAEAVNYLIDNSSQREMLATAAMHRARAFRYDTMIEQYLSLYAGMTNEVHTSRNQVEAYE